MLAASLVRSHSLISQECIFLSLWTSLQSILLINTNFKLFLKFGTSDEKQVYAKKKVTKLATLQTQPKPRAFHPYPWLQQAEAFIVHLLMQKIYQVIQVWEGRRVKCSSSSLCWKPCAAHTPHPSGSPAWLPGHAHQEDCCIFSPNIREQWRD